MLAGDRSNLSIDQIKIFWCYSKWNEKPWGTLLSISFFLRELSKWKGRLWIISRSTMYGWVGCILHKSRTCQSHKSQFKWQSSSHTKHSSHPWHSMLCGFLFCFMWISYLLSEIINTSRAEFKFFLLFFKLPSTVSNAVLLKNLWS